MKEKLAIFGDCIPIGHCSFYVLGENRLLGKSNSLLNGKPLISLVDELKEIYDVDSFCERNYAVSYKGCCHVKYTDSIVYKILNNDLSIYDTIIIWGCIHDYRHANIMDAPKDDMNPKSVHGAYNLIIKELKERYPDKKVIFILPLWSKKKNNVNFGDFISLLKEKIEKSGYKYISFYDYIKKYIKFEWQWRILFPDGFHPSLDCRYILNEYIIEKLK